MPSHVFAPMINKVRFDPMRDFKHIALLGGLPNILLAHPSVAITTFDEFLAFVRSQQGSVGYGSPGVGTVGHFLMEYLAKKETLNLHHIPYKGGGNAILDLLAGHVKIGIVSLQTIRGQISKRALNPIATVTANRAADFPDIPTLKELGYPELVAPMWFSLSGPRELSDEITTRLNKAVVESLNNPRVRKYLVQESIETMPMTQVEFTAYVQSEIDKWQPIIKSLEKK
jgi:tripartite-type tricarboxylate transporter receptor subunit TctC